MPEHKTQRFILPSTLCVLAFLSLTGAAPKSSGYSDVPQKKEAIASGNEANNIREESVKPEEVYKYGVQEFAVIASDTGYFPSKIIVRRNIPVKLYLTSASTQSLCFVMDDFSIRKGVQNMQTEQVNFLPTKAGQYKFYCPVKEIEGSIVVRD
jgi:heme/copper-type cytochrome/quinol oxidase subunit 2